MDVREKLVDIVCDAMEDGCVGHCNHAPCFPVERVVNALIAHGVTVQEWISVNDRLPFAECGESDDVLAITELGVIRTLYFDGGNWCFQNGECCSHKVTHWMPLPEPPKGE